VNAVVDQIVHRPSRVSRTMRRTSLVFSTISLLTLVACERPAPVRSVDGEGSGTPVPTATQPVVLDASPDVADTSDTADAPATLPPLDTACAVDTDCDWVGVDLSGKYTCCLACGTTIGSKTWVAAVKAVCAKRPPTVCYPLACPMGPTKSRCDKGHCVAMF
jgi:hypothetical protein